MNFLFISVSRPANIPGSSSNTKTSCAYFSLFCKHHCVSDGEGEILVFRLKFPNYLVIDLVSAFLITSHLIFFFFQPHVDFGMNILGGDIMSIPGLYQFVQVLLLHFFVSAP